MQDDEAPVLIGQENITFLDNNIMGRVLGDNF